MDFKISAGSGKRGACPECGKKVMPMVKAGVKQLVCSCGWSKVLDTYPKNSIDPKQIETR